MFGVRGNNLIHRTSSFNWWVAVENWWLMGTYCHSELDSLQRHDWCEFVGKKAWEDLSWKNSAGWTWSVDLSGRSNRGCSPTLPLSLPSPGLQYALYVRKLLEGMILQHCVLDVIWWAAVEQELGKRAFSVEVMQKLAGDSQRHALSQTRCKIDPSLKLSIVKGFSDCTR